MSDDVKKYSGSTSCLRKMLFSPFSESVEIESLSPSHSCCSVCSESCNCDDEKCKFSYFIEINRDNPIEKVRTVGDKDCSAIQEKLLHLHLSKSSSESLIVPSGIASGLTNDIIFKIVDHLHFIDSVNYIMSNLPILEESLAVEIYEIILHHFKEQHQCAHPAVPYAVATSSSQQYEFGDFDLDDDFPFEEEFLDE